MSTTTDDITFDQRSIENIDLFGTSNGIFDPSAGFLRIKQLIELIEEREQMIERAILVIRRYSQPGDVKFSLRKYVDNGDLSQMPGYVPWIPGLVLNKADYPGLYAAIGSASSSDSEDVTTFTLPDHLNGLVRVTAVGETPGNTETNIAEPYATGSGPVSVRLSAWIKT